ncbi:GIN domain-containing protein [Georgenia daeguensis]|uniref:Putative auto-transporter adhesin head GIN domain-containing protein n=1 Tax=Georgenia daeguensis TaxID=908355 RepID=A0ABP8ETV4_9MICO
MTTRTLTATLGLLSAVALLTAGCGIAGPTGAVTTEKHDVDASVTAVRLDGTGDLRVRTGGPAASLSVTAHESTLDELTTEVQDGVLVLGVRPGMRLRDLGPVTYDLVLPGLDAIGVQGTGDVAASLTPGDSLRIAVEGTGEVRATDVDVDDLLVEIDGTGSVGLAGTARSQEVRIGGTGSYEGAALSSENAVVTLSGTGSADVEASRSLSATVEGTGSVTYGGGADVTSRVDGLGTVRER